MGKVLSIDEYNFFLVRVLFLEKNVRITGTRDGPMIR